MIQDSVVLTVLVELGFWAVIVTVAFLIAFMPTPRNKQKPNKPPEFLDGPPFGKSEDK